VVRREGERCTRRSNVPHENGNGESALGLLAEASDGTGLGDGAALSNVPRWPRLRVFGVAHVGAGLAVDADGVEGDEEGVHEEGNEGQEDVRDVHGCFDQQDEHRKHGDDDVVVCDAKTIVCQFAFEVGGFRVRGWGIEDRTIQSKPSVPSMVDSWLLRR